MHMYLYPYLIHLLHQKNVQSVVHSIYRSQGQETARILLTYQVGTYVMYTKKSKIKDCSSIGRNKLVVWRTTLQLSGQANQNDGLPMIHFASYSELRKQLPSITFHSKDTHNLWYTFRNLRIRKKLFLRRTDDHSLFSSLFLSRITVCVPCISGFE